MHLPVVCFLAKNLKSEKNQKNQFFILVCSPKILGAMLVGHWA